MSDTDRRAGELSSRLHLAADNARVSLHGFVLSTFLSCTQPQMVTALLLIFAAQSVRVRGLITGRWYRFQAYLISLKSKNDC